MIRLSAITAIGASVHVRVVIGGIVTAESILVIVVKEFIYLKTIASIALVIFSI